MSTLLASFDLELGMYGGVWFDTCQMAAEGMNGPPMPGDIQIELNDLIWNLNPN